MMANTKMNGAANRRREVTLSCARTIRAAASQSKMKIMTTITCVRCSGRASLGIIWTGGRCIDLTRIRSAYGWRGRVSLSVTGGGHFKVKKQTGQPFAASLGQAFSSVSTTASASNSMSQSGSMKPDTCIIVLAGRISPKNSP